MDGSAFDRLTRALNGVGSRRSLLGLLSAAPPLAGLLAILDPDDSAANGRRKRRKKRHKHDQDRRRKHNNDKKPCKGKHCLGSGDCPTACGPGQVCQDGVCGVVCGSDFCPAASEICDRDRLRCERCGVTCPSGSCQDTKVSEAVAAARAGARIYICPGRYVETDSIVITQNLTLYGAGAGDDPAFATILDGGRNVLPVVAVNSSSVIPVTIRNLSITNGNAISGGLRGGGIVKSQGELTLEDVTISQCRASDVGGGIFNLAGQLTLERTTITACTAKNSGGGIVNASGGGVTLTESTVSGCTAEGDGENDGFGGGIFNDGELNDPGVVHLDRSTVSDCSAAVGGGIFNRGALRLEHAVVSGNAANVRGGGLFSTGDVELVGGTEIRGNRGATEAAGQGVDNDGGSVTCQEEVVDPLVCGNPDDATATAASNCAGVTASSCRAVCRGDTTPGSGACPE